MNVLAVMERRDAWGNADLAFVLYCVGAVAAVAILAFLPLRRARVNRSRWLELIVAGVVLWSALSIVTLIATEIQRRRAQDQWQVQIRSGYFDPHDMPQPPRRPWELWLALGTVYGGLLLFSGLGKRIPPPPPIQ